MEDASTACGGIESLLSAALRFIEANTTSVIMSEVFLQLDFEIMQMIFKRDSLNEGVGEVQIYLAVLRWGRCTGNLDINDLAQFDTTEILKSERLQEVRKLLKLVRLPLIPAEILFKLIYPGRLVEMEDLFIATAF
jgi:hypothetical protein